MEVPGGMPHLRHVSPRMLVVLQIQHTLASLMFCVISCQCVPPSGRVCAGCWADLGQHWPRTFPVLLFTCVWNKSPVQQAVCDSFSFSSLPISAGP